MKKVKTVTKLEGLVCVLQTGKVVELVETLHYDGNKRQIELSYMCSDLSVTVAWVCIMATQQGMNSANRLFMKEESPVGKKKRKIQSTWLTFLDIPLSFI